MSHGISGWAAQAIAGGHLFSAQWELTERCNLRCAHCYLSVRARQGAHTTEELDAIGASRLLDELVELGALFLTLTGGEVFLREDLLEICGAARQRGLGLRLLTNATLVDAPTARALHELGVLSVELTLYGGSAEGYRRATGDGAGFARALEGIQALRTAQVPVVLKTFYMRANGDEMDAIETLARDLGLPLTRAMALLPRYDDGFVPLKAGLTRAQLARMGSIVGAPGIEDRYEEVRQARLCGRCGVGRVFITSRGDVTPCGSLRHVVLGNLRERSLVDIWRDQETERRLERAQPGTRACDVGAA